MDDERLILRLLKKFFSQAGYIVLTASDGQLALEVYRRHKDEIAAVILDIRLPKTTGVEVYRKMKEINPLVKVIVASGYLAANIPDDPNFAGVARFINKPYILSELLAVVQDVLGNKEPKH